MIHPSAHIHATSIVEEGATVGMGASVWHFCHLRKGAVLHEQASLGRDVYLDSLIEVGRGSRVQNGVSLYNGVHVGEWCFIGPHAVFTNDLYPRAGRKGWTVIETFLENGAAIGAGVIVRCGVRIGAFAMIGAGAVVTKSVPAFQLAVGLPAESTSWICACGETRIPLETAVSLNELVRECCSRSLLPEVLLLARESARLVNS